jgi:DNA-binding ferritin-like protein (Dps family)
MDNYFRIMFNSNEFDILVKENRLRSEYLSIEDKSILKKLVSRLSVSKLSAFDIQIAQKDLIGMALEAEQRGETLSSVIGSDMKAFCDEIIKNGRKKSCKETIILALPSVFFSLTFMYGIIYIVLNSSPAVMKITLYESLLYMFWCFIGIPLGNYLEGKNTFESKFKKTLSVWIFLGFLVFIAFSNRIFFSKQVVLFEVIAWVPLAVTCFLTMSFYILRNKYLRSLAKRYNWSDS